MKKRIFLSPPFMFGIERELIDEAFASNYIAPCGPMVERFERTLAEKTGFLHACALSSCTAGLDLLFHELGVVSGDTVFCSNLTFIASIAPAVHRGATPVFIGSDAASWTISPELLEEALNDSSKAGNLPKAVVAADLYGQCCDYDIIEDLCREFEVPLIIDAAEALGAVYCGHQVAAKRVKGVSTPTAKECRQAGDAGWAALYSFNGNKIITSSGGGMILSHDEGLISRANKRSQQSRDAGVWYEHSELGYNYRMSNIVAAIGLGQLLNLDKIVKRKRVIFESYKSLLGDLVEIEFMPEAGYGRCNRWLTVALLGERGGAVESVGEPSSIVISVIDALERENIEVRPLWKPMHLQPVFKDCRVYGQKVDEDLFNRGICLPSGTGLSDDDIQRISALVRKSLAIAETMG